mmetsp:Transcript_29205/g.30326  ORF Transcript_29205/g.30326 Transcript_29205/m.30326 type:complete len:245 (-) Transcript_29205:62-796(-)
MFGGKEIFSRSLFAEASNQVQKFLSTSTLTELKKETQNKSPEDRSVLSIIYMFLSRFAKIYGIRMLFMSVAMLSKKDLMKNLSAHLLNALVNKSSFRTALFVSSIPTLYNLLHKYLKDYLDVNSTFFTFIAGFVSAFIGFSFEEKTGLVKFMVLSVLGRTIISCMTYYAVSNNYPASSKLASYLGLLLICTSFNALNYYVPSFKPVSGLVNKYGLLVLPEEFQEMNQVRLQANLLPNETDIPYN